jgi:hypothetical protein
VRGLTCIAAAVALSLPAAPARGDDKGAVVGVLPLSTTSKRMAIYAKPVADALAKRLRSSITTPKVGVESLSTSGAVPTRFDLVVHGRIVRAKGGVMLEARVHDPARGHKWRTVATSTRKLTAIDVLAGELAAKLAPRVDAAIATQRRRRAAELAARKRRRAEARARKPVQLPVTVVHGRWKHGKRVTPRGEQDKRPRMVVLRAGAHSIKNPDMVADLVTQNAYRLADLVGFRGVASSRSGLVSPDMVRSEIRRTGARWALMIDVRKLSFRWRGKVMTARGRLRVVVIAPNGKVVYDRTARTGTLVGSRGDRNAALVHFVAEQVVDIVAPHLRRALKAGSS